MRVFATLLALAIASPATAQDEPGFFERLFRSDQAESDAEQGSLLEQLLEDQLSGAGRQVTIEGFQGALTGAAKMARLTISDDQGVWLTLTDAELDWNRAALFKGSVEVSKLTAGEIDLPRLPTSDSAPSTPTPEATGFKLPELPVSIAIDEISAGRVLLGAPILGTAAEISTNGSLSLTSGDGTAKLNIERLDGRGTVALDVGFSNTSNVLALDLSMDEAEDGIVATLLGLPGRPAVVFGVQGEGPLSEYTADLRLATDGAPRVTGQISTFALGDTIGLATDLSGDIAPLFDAEYQAFFGQDAGLGFSVFQTEGGGTVVKDLSITAEALSLTGEAILGPDGMPRRFTVLGSIGDDTNAPVLLPFAGEETYVDSVQLDVAFDASEGEGWTGSFEIDQFARGAFEASAMDLTVTGQIISGTVDQVVANATYRINDLTFGDPSLETAIGDDLQGLAQVDWESGRDLQIPQLTLVGESYQFESSAVVTTGEVGPQITGTALARLGDLSGFSDVVDRALSGATSLRLDFDATPLAGVFDVAASGTGQDLALDDPRADAILKGPSTLDLSVERDADGLRVQLTTLETEQANLTGWANLVSGGSSLLIEGSIADAGLLLDGLAGDITLDMSGTEDANRDWDLTAVVEGDTFGADWDGRLIDLFGVPRAEGALQVDASRLADFSALAGRSLGGVAKIDANGSASFDLSAYSIESTVSGDRLKTGIAELDRLLDGPTRIDLIASGTDDTLSLSKLRLESETFEAEVSGTLGQSGSSLIIAAVLEDVAPFVSDLRGPARVSGTVESADGETLALDFSGTGPGGIRAAVSGRASNTFDDLALNIDGNVPLQLANTALSPNSLAGQLALDVSVNGAPALGSVSGRLSAEGVRFVAPEAGIALNNISLLGSLGAGRLQLDMTGGVEGGGRLEVRGPVGLESPYLADLSATLRNARVTDPSLFETIIDGSVAVTGPLAGGARVSGALGLGLTEIRIPSSGLGGAGAIPEIVHLNEPPPVRGTRRRAGLLATASGSGGGLGVAYPLDLTITAPNQVFVRGRGLDSEFGGALRLAGTTANIIPSGGFNLIRGRLDILGRRLDMTQAQITMQGSFIPRLNLVAATDVEDYSVAVEVTGPADNPDIAFGSTPELPQEEVVARLIFGRGIASLSALQAARLALAIRTLAGKGGEGVVEKIRSGTGLADLDITTTDDGNAAVRAGAYLNENIYTDLTVDSSGETELNLNLDVTPSLTLKGGTTSDGNTSVGIFFERDY